VKVSLKNFITGKRSLGANDRYCTDDRGLICRGSKSDLKTAEPDIWIDLVTQKAYDQVKKERAELEWKLEVAVEHLTEIKTMHFQNNSAEFEVACVGLTLIEKGKPS